MELDLFNSIRGKDVIVVEDIVDTGQTLTHLLAHLQVKEPNSIKLCALLDKPERRVNPVLVDYVGFTIPDEFVVGYGLDFNQQHRNLPYIGYFERELEPTVDTLKSEEPKKHSIMPIKSQNNNHNQ